MNPSAILQCLNKRAIKLKDFLFTMSLFYYPVGDVSLFGIKVYANLR